MQYKYNVEKFKTASDLEESDFALLNRARQATKLAYAPYSNFYVGSAAKLTNGEIIVGSNQENASFGVTLCAERVLLASLSAIYPKESISTLAISFLSPKGNHNNPLSPCGICRQALLEHELSAKQPLKIIMAGQDGEVWVIDSASILLPLAFTHQNMI